MKLTSAAALFILLILVSARQLWAAGGSFLALSTFGMSCTGLGVVIGQFKHYLKQDK